MTPDMHWGGPGFNLGVSQDVNQDVYGLDDVGMPTADDPIQALASMGIPEWEAVGMIARACGTEAAVPMWNALVASGASGRQLAQAARDIAMSSPEAAQSLMWDRFASGPVQGPLDLAHSAWLLAIPPGTHVKGDFCLDGCHALAPFPEDMVVEGRLSILDCPQITLLPGDLKAGGPVVADRVVHVDRPLDVDDALARGLSMHEAISMAIGASNLLRHDGDQWGDVLKDSPAAPRFFQATDAVVRPNEAEARQWEHRFLATRERGRDLADRYGIPRDRVDRLVGMAMLPALASNVAMLMLSGPAKAGCPLDPLVDSLTATLDLDRAGDPMGRRPGMIRSADLQKIIDVLSMATPHKGGNTDGRRMGWWDQVREGWCPPPRPSVGVSKDRIKGILEAAAREGRLDLPDGCFEGLEASIKDVQGGERDGETWTPAFRTADDIWVRTDYLILEAWAFAYDAQAADQGMLNEATRPERFVPSLPRRLMWGAPDHVAARLFAMPSVLPDILQPVGIQGPIGEWLSDVMDIGTAPIIGFHQGVDPVTTAVMAPDVSGLVTHLGRIRAAEAMVDPGPGMR